MNLFSRLFFIVLLASLLISSCGVNDISQVEVLPMENRPNIIFILADDLDLKLNTIAYMENLQNLLIRRGTAVDDFLISTSTCCPSRMNILRGQFTHNHQVYNNTAPYGGFKKLYESGFEESTLPVWLQAAGYRTALMGKYLNEYPLREDRTYVPPGWSEWVSPGRKNAYDGYDYVLNENGILVEYPPKEIYYFTDVMNRKAVDFIERASSDDIPFFLYLSTFAPHEPATPAQRHAELFSDIAAPRTISFNEEDVSDKPANIAANPMLSEADILKIDEIYRQRVRSMQAVDEMLADLIDTLERTGEIENTYIVFTSDQGLHLGQHRLVYGKSSMYEEDIIVPFVIRGPDIPENKSIPPFLAGSIDLAPTIAELAGVVPPEFIDGRSFAGVLKESPVPSDWRRAFLLEFYITLDEKESNSSFHASASLTSQFYGIFFETFDGLPKRAGLRTLEYTYIENPDGFIELYDLKNDPHQLENLARTTEPDVLEKYSSWLNALESCQGAECRRLDQSMEFLSE